MNRLTNGKRSGFKARPLLILLFFINTTKFKGYKRITAFIASLVPKVGVEPTRGESPAGF